MGWAAARPAPIHVPRVDIEPDPIDWDRLVTLDFETYYDNDYTLKKLSTSEYIRDARFKAQMMSIKIGRKPTRVIPGNRIGMVLNSIPWSTHSLLAHHVQFDAFIAHHHFGISPKKLYCSLSMARALHSTDIGAGLHEVSVFYGGAGKIDGVLEKTKGVRNWSKELYDEVAPYCTNDLEECLRVFKAMHVKMPRDEMDFIDVVCRMFTEPVLKVDIPRVRKELAREIAAKRALLLNVATQASDVHLVKKELAALGPNPSEEDIAVRRAKKLIGSDRFAELLRAEGVEPPVKVSPAYFKHRDEERKWANAFSKTDLDFIALQEHPSERVRNLVEARLSVKSTIGETRAGRFLEAGKDGANLPVYLKYGAALTHRLGGGNKMNMQNLERGGELRRSIQAPPGHVIVVVDSGQIEARKNAWLWDQQDLLQQFRDFDAGRDRDPYCKFADIIYKRTITTADKEERFVGKVGILALGYQMGPDRLQRTLALGQMGPKVLLDIEQCGAIVGAYRGRNHMIKRGWAICQQIIEDMANGVPGSHKCISWDKETIYLPNGLTLRYPGLHDRRVPISVARRLNPELDDGEDIDMDRPQYQYEFKGKLTKLYGGKLCENIVQALARIVVLKQTLNIARKHRVVMSTHDEAALLVKKAQGQRVYDYARGEFMKPLPWCRDLPLNADGGFDVVYSK